MTLAAQPGRNLIGLPTTIMFLRKPPAASGICRGVCLFKPSSSDFAILDQAGFDRVGARDDANAIDHSRFDLAFFDAAPDSRRRYIQQRSKFRNSKPQTMLGRH